MAELPLLGEALTAHEGAIDAVTLKVAMQELVFSRSGRLSLYFANEFQRLVGRATSLAAVLEALAEGPSGIADLARAIGAASGSTVRYLERLSDAVRRREDGLWELSDPVFGLWLRWRKPGGAVVPMTLVGDDAEREVAHHLARMGFDLVYQSRASRGAFDLLALRGPTHLGVQVKRTDLPVRFSLSDWARMDADAKRLGWRWIVVVHTPAGDVAIFDPARARRGKEMRLGDVARIDNLLAWLDAPS